MESFMRKARQWGRVVSVLFALLALARARKQSEVEYDLQPIFPNIYTGGPFEVYDPFISEEPPRPVLIVAPVPIKHEEFPVVLFQHGYGVNSTSYTQLLKHVASYGFIAVAPTLCTMDGDLDSDATNEICSVAAVINWFPNELSKVLPEPVKPNLSKLAVVGHSRGGKVVFGLAKHICEISLTLSAIVGLDPVDGFVVQTSPHILHFIPHDLKLDMPTLIVGGRIGCIDLCRSSLLSHDQFFIESDAPAFHFVSKKNAHMDYLNGECPNCIRHPEICKDNYCLICGLCNGPREAMRNFSGGITVAFLEGSLNKNYALLKNAIENYTLAAPVTLEPPTCYRSCPTSIDRLSS